MLKNIIFFLLFTLNYSTEYNSLIDAIKSTNSHNLSICNGGYVLTQHTNNLGGLTGILNIESNYCISILDLLPASIIIILSFSLIGDLEIIDKIISPNQSIIILIIIALIQSIVHLVRISNITALKKQKCLFILHRKNSLIMSLNVTCKVIGIMLLFIYHCFIFYGWYINKPISSSIILNIISFIVHIIYGIITIKLSKLFPFIDKILKHKDLPKNYFEENYYNSPNKYLVLNIDNEKVIMNI